MAKSVAVTPNGLIYDSDQSTAAQLYGAVYDTNTKKWNLSGRNYK